MNLHRRFRACAYLMVVLSYSAYALAESSPLILLLGVFAAAFSWILVERQGKPIPRWMINIGVLLSSLLLFWELVIHGQESLLRALAHFMAAILACKLFEKKSNRDFSQILTLSLLIIVTGAIFTATMVFGLILAAYLATGLYAVLLFHLRAESLADAAPAAPAPPPADASLRRDVRFIALAAAFFLLLIASAIFLVLPRNKGREFFANWALNRGTAVTGFSDHVLFTDFGRLQQSNAIVMEVTLTQGSVNIGSPIEQPYFRGTSFEIYDPSGPQWVRRIPPNSDHFPITHDPPLTNAPLVLLDPAFYNPTWLTQQNIRLYPGASGNTLFSVSPAVSFERRDADIHSVHQSVRDGTLSFNASRSDHIDYTVTTPVIYQPEATLSPRSIPFDFIATVPRLEYVVPEDIHKVALRVAGDLLPKAGTRIGPEASRKIAERFEDYLRNNYAYSLEIHTIDSSLDPVSDFLLNRQKVGGHCQYFAAAMALMCQSLGIEARLVTGYHGGDFNTIDNVYTVRQRHAHAWVEVLTTRPEWRGKVGWVQFDPTPSSDAAPTGLDSWTSWFSELFQVIERGWLSTIIAFDNSSRDYLAAAIMNPIHNAYAFAGGFLADLRIGVENQTVGPEASTTSRLKVTIPILLLIPTCLWLSTRVRRRRNSEVRAAVRLLPRAKRRQLTDDLAFYDELMLLLRKSGIRRTPDQTPREYVTTICQNVAPATDHALWLVDRYYEFRFGPVRISAPLRAHIKDRLSQLRRTLKQAP